MKVALRLSILLLMAMVAVAQEPTDPAFDPPLSQSSTTGGKVRFNGAIGMVIIDGKAYQQFALRPDIPFGKFGVGLDLTFRFDENGQFKDDEWKHGKDYLEKIYYIRYGLPGDPFYARVGALDNVTLGYGLIMKRYCNTIQYPEVKRIGVYTEGEFRKVGWQAMMNNLSELDQPGLMAARLSYNTGLANLTLGGTVAHDGNMFAGIRDKDKDGVPDRIDLFPNRNDFSMQQQLLNLFSNSPEELNYLIDNHLLPDVRRRLISYRNMKESVTELGVDAGIPLYRGGKFSIWTYAQAAKIVDYGWGWAAPGIRAQVGPLQISGEFRRFEKQFRGEFFNYVYEIERVQLKNDTLFETKEKTLENLGTAKGFYADALLSIGTLGYGYAWYQDMHGKNYPGGSTFYGEAGVTPPSISRLQKVAGYYMQSDVSARKLFRTSTDGTVYGAKAFFAIAQNVSLVYDHRISYYNGQSHRTVRVETMITF
jgi:hypothetical protein